MSAIAATPSPGGFPGAATPYSSGASSSPRPLWPTPRRVAYVGPQVWLDACAPTTAALGLEPRRFAVGSGSAGEDIFGALKDFAPDVAVIIDPPALDPELAQALASRTFGCVTLGVLVGGVPGDGDGFDDACCDRLVSFDSGVTGARVGDTTVWRAVPPPVSDVFFADVGPLHAPCRAITIGRATEHRERILAGAKHHHDLMQVLHGISGAELAELLSQYDVGVYIPPRAGAGFGVQVGMHLAAGHLLLAGLLAPAHGLERDIDYLQVDSSDGLAWVLERLARFPEMYYRMRVRGHMKSEQYRASRLFARLVHDLLADVAAFGRR
jgi:hypothetical protein